MPKTFGNALLILVGIAGLYLALSFKVEKEVRQQTREILAAMEQNQRSQMATIPLPGPSDPEHSSVTQLLDNMERLSSLIPPLARSAPEEKKNVEEQIEDLAEELGRRGEEGLQGLITRVHRPGTLEFRRRLLRMISKQDAAKGFDTCEEIFHREGEDLTVRWAAAYVMRDLDPERTTPILRKFVLANDGSRHAGMLYLIEILGHIGTSDAQTTVLAVAMDREKTSSVRHKAVDVLGDMRMTEAVPFLRQVVLETANGYLRRNAARSLVAIQPEESCVFLREVLGKEPHAEYVPFLESLIQSQCK